MPRIGGSPRALAYRPEQQFDAEEAFEPGNDIVVDLDDYRPGGRPDAFEMRNGEVAEAEDADPIADVGDFGRNLALELDEKYLDDEGRRIIDLIEDAITERAPWRDRFERGLEMMGLVESDLDDGPFPGASNAVHPLLIEARTQFWARAMGELWPPEGPAKAKVYGAQTEIQLQRGDRVAEFMNWDLTVQDEGYMEESSSLVWDLPFYGSCFRKTYRDPVLDQNTGIYVPADDLIVPAEARSLRTTPFFAHRMRKWPNEVRQLRLSGHYRDVDLDLPSSEESDETQTLKDETQDVTPDGDEASVRHELFETYINLSLKGDEHRDADGRETGLERTYVVTVDRHTAKILAIYRGWREQDQKFRRRLYFRHYRFAPPGAGGFYGSGLFHLIGGLQIAATGTLRVLLDSAAAASLSGGFISRHANLKGKSIVFTPGVWQPVDATGEDLAKAFFSPPVKEPSPALFQLLGFLTEQGAKYTATTELMTGDADPKGSPVGTTNMMIEQGGRVMSTIHRMMHNTLREELRDRYELDREHAPPDGYPYEVADQQRTVYADDFAPGVTVDPVSDPNIFSSSQRIAQAQAVYQVAMESGAVPIPKAVRRMFQAMRIPDIDDLVPPDPEPLAYDPAGEIQALFLGKPVKVVPEQPHVMHLQHLAAFTQNPQFGGNQQVMQQIGPGLMSVIAQHMAYAWATHARGLGAPVGYMDPQTGQVQPGGPGTPEQIASMLAQMAPQLATVPGMPPLNQEGQEGGGDQKLQIEFAKLQIEREKHAQDMQMAREKHQFDLQKEQADLEAKKSMNAQKVQLAAQKAHSDLQIAQVKAQQAMQQAQMDGEIKRQQAAHQMQVDQQTAQQQQEMDAHKMQQEAAMGEQEMVHKQRQGEQELALGQQKAAAQQPQAVGPDRLQHLREPQQDGGQGGMQ